MIYVHYMDGYMLMLCTNCWRCGDMSLSGVFLKSTEDWSLIRYPSVIQLKPHGVFKSIEINVIV